MSNNIKHISIAYTREPLRISREVYNNLKALFEDLLPECSIFDESWASASQEKQGYLYPKTIWWCYMGSANTLSVFTERVLPEFEGSVDLVVYYECGNLEGYRLDKHKVTKHNVKLTLEEDCP